MIYAVRTQRNMRFHVVVAVLVLVASLLVGVRKLELAVLVLTILLVFVTELFNTAMEFVVDLATREYHPLAKLAKDVSAGAVLVSKDGAVLIGYLVLADDLRPLSLDPGEHKAPASPPHARHARCCRAHRSPWQGADPLLELIRRRDAFRARGCRLRRVGRRELHSRPGWRGILRRDHLRDLTPHGPARLPEPRRERDSQRLPGDNGGRDRGPRYDGSLSTLLKGGALDPEAVMEAARVAANRAYAPYSNFHVGAAILTGGGTIHSGANVENASYGLSICAERNAVTIMATTDPEDREIELVAVFSPNSSPCFPCGACRQVLKEFGCKEVVVETARGLQRYPFDQILPNSFGPEDL